MSGKLFQTISCAQIQAIVLSFGLYVSTDAVTYTLGKCDLKNKYKCENKVFFACKKVKNLPMEQMKIHLFADITFYFRQSLYLTSSYLISSKFNEMYCTLTRE